MVNSLTKFWEKHRSALWYEIGNSLQIIAVVLVLGLWYSKISDEGTLLSNLFMIAGTLFSTYIVGRLLQLTKLKTEFQRILYFVWIFIALLISIQFQFLSISHQTLVNFLQGLFEFSDPDYSMSGVTHLFFMLLVFFMAEVFSKERPIARSGITHFQISLLALLLYTMIFSNSLSGFFIIEFLIFLFCYITSIALLKTLENDPSHSLLFFSKEKSTILTIIIILGVSIGLFTFFISLILNNQVAHFLSSGTVLLLQGIVLLILILFAPLALLIILIAQFIQDLLARYLNRAPEEQPLQEAESFVETLGEEIANNSELDLRTILITAAFVIVLIIIIYNLRTKPWENVETGDADLESEKVSQKKSPFRFNFRRNRNVNKNLSRKSRQIAEKIRRIYAELMDVCAQLETPRKSAETPYEFLPKLKGLFPDFENETVILTEAYNKVRYGQIPETDQELKTVDTAWNKISDYIEPILKEKKQHKKKNRLV